MSRNEELEQCWIQWIAKARELAVADTPCAAPFLSAKPAGYDNCSHRLLLVGMATKGWVWGHDLDLSSSLTDVELCRHQCKTNLDFREYWTSHRGFWPFLLKTAALFGDETSNPKNLIWSNLFKIGGPKGNPSKALIHLQQTLATKTLSAEIQAYRPTLVILTTVAYYEDVVHAAVGENYKKKWSVENEGQPEESWALIAPDLPAMLWVRHPARKSTRAITAWLERAKAVEKLREAYNRETVKILPP